MLSNVNSLSASRMAMAEKEFMNHTRNMMAMKKELESIFKRIRGIKVKLAHQMPLAAVAGGWKEKVMTMTETEEEDDEYDIALKE